MKNEMLDVINENDKVVGKASYDEIHEKKLLHRVVNALLINDVGEVLLQLRSEYKRAFPLHWSFSIGGHVRHSETYLSALVREAKEETGLTFPQSAFTEKGSGFYTDSFGHKVIYKTFEVRYDGPIETRHDKEVAALQFVTWNTISTLIREGKEKIQPEAVDVMKRHWPDKFSF